MATPAVVPDATWRQALRRVSDELAPHEARVLLEEVAGRPLAALLADPDAPLTISEQSALDDLVRLRASGVPLQHVVGHWSFRGVELLVDGRALVPRPETELVVEVALVELARRRDEVGATRAHFAPLVIDLGTGTGAIACAIADEVTDVEVIAIDASSEALALARANVDRLGPGRAERIELREGSWFAPLRSPSGRLVRGADLIVANPPYLSEEEWRHVDPVVRDYDPKSALVAGPVGDEDLAMIIAEAGDFLAPGAALVCEIGATQGERVRALATSTGARSARVERDLAGRDRIAVLRFS